MARKTDIIREGKKERDCLQGVEVPKVFEEHDHPTWILNLISRITRSLKMLTLYLKRLIQSSQLTSEELGTLSSPFLSLLSHQSPGLRYIQE
jgi:hypothetical protein